MSETEWGKTPPRDLAEQVAARGEQSTAALADLLRADQEQRWARGQRIGAEDYLRWFPQMSDRAEDVLLLIYCEILKREPLGERPGVEEYLTRFPRFAEPIRQQFELHSALLAGQTTPPVEAATLPPRLESAVGVTPGTTHGDLPGYEVLRELGRGGMGVVHQARQTGLSRVVALKMILSGAHTSADDLARFAREAEAVARLNHPNVVQVYHVGKRDGLPFFAMEFCAGGSLAEQLGGKPQPPRRAAEVIETLARAVQAAHEAGVVHRDLKPANVLIDSTGTLKITDFGLAKKLDGAVDLTQTGAIMGTPSYMAPEQASGDGKRVGPAADIYALGAILYECLTGRPPFQGPTPLDTIMMVLGGELAPPRRLRPTTPAALEAICLKCLRKVPGHRYASAAALAEDLRRFRDGLPLQIDEEPGTSLTPKQRQLRRGLLGCLSFLFGMAAIGLLGLFASGLESEKRATKERERRGLIQVESIPRAESADGRCWAVAITHPTRPAGKIHRAYLHRDEVESSFTLASPCTVLAFSRDSSLLAVGEESGNVEVWDTVLERRRCTFQGKGPVQVLLFSADGRSVLSATGSNADQPSQVEEVGWWEVATGRRQSILSVLGLLSPDGRTLAQRGRAGPIRLWDTPSGKVRCELPVTEDRVSLLLYSPDSGTLLAASKDRIVYLRDPATGKIRVTLDGRAGMVTRALFSADGKRLVTVDEERWFEMEVPGIVGRGGQFRLWDAGSGVELAAFVCPGIPQAITPDARHLVTQLGSGRLDKQRRKQEADLSLIELPSGEVVLQVKGGDFLGYSADGKTVFTSRGGLERERWDAKVFWSRAEVKPLSGWQ